MLSFLTDISTYKVKLNQEFSFDLYKILFLSFITSFSQEATYQEFIKLQLLPHDSTYQSILLPSSQTLSDKIYLKIKDEGVFAIY